jgi:hypothetical protein
MHEGASGEDCMTRAVWSVVLTKCLDDLIQMNEMGEAYGVYGGEHSCMVGKTEGKRPIRRTGHRWKDKSKLDLK